MTSSNASSIPSGVINVICRLPSLKSTIILPLITLHMSPYKFVYDAACHCSPIDSNFNTPTPSYPRTNIALGSLYLFGLFTYGRTYLDEKLLPRYDVIPRLLFYSYHVPSFFV